MTIGLTYPPHPHRGSIVSTTDRRGLNLSVYRCFQNYYHGHRFLSPNPSYIANVRLSINHWQIRDLVQVDAPTGSVFHTVDENIRVLSMKTGKLNGPIRTRNHLTLPYRPRCFHHAAGGLVVAGGVLTTLAKVYLMSLPNLTADFKGGCRRKQAKGLFSIYSPGMGEAMSFQLGDMINNAVTIYPQQNSTAAYTSYVCNNDSSLYIVDISDSGIKGARNIVCDANTSLNNVHQAAHGKALTVTGDSGNIFLVDPLLPQPVFQTIKTPHDSGFGILYHNNELIFAAAFQNGTCSMFDLRNTRSPIHEIKSTRPGHQSGAFRTCRFLNSPIQELLVVLEHLGRVHMIDVRDFSKESHQVMVFPFALDQYARYKTPGEQQLEDDLETDMHLAVKVYADEKAHFTAPLVYDYEYLTEVSSKPFKGFTYEPQHVPLAEKQNIHETSVARPLQDRVSAAAAAECVSLEDHPHMDAGSHRMYTRYSRELYQESVNHINGEMEIAGLDWHNSQLFVGCEDGGLLVWDVNVRARRSFGSFSYV